MMLEHTEAIKQAVLAGLGVAFVSVHAVRGDLATGRLRGLRVPGLRIVRHFHLIHHERRRLSASARAFTDILAATPSRPPRTLDPGRRPGEARPGSSDAASP
jgi:DNA-binding transcriptional LysR family regulator